MMRYQATVHIEQEAGKVSGFRGFLVNKVLPLIKDLMIDILLEYVQDRKRAADKLEDGIKKLPGIKGFLVYQVWPFIKEIIIDILVGERRR